MSICEKSMLKRRIERESEGTESQPAVDSCRKAVPSVQIANCTATSAQAVKLQKIVKFTKKIALFKTNPNSTDDDDDDDDDVAVPYLANGDTNVTVDGHEKTIRFNIVRIFTDDTAYFYQVVGLVNPHVAAVVNRNARNPRFTTVAILVPQDQLTRYARYLCQLTYITFHHRFCLHPITCSSG